MTAKEYLRQLGRMDARINALAERQQRYYDLAARATTVYRSMPGGGRRCASSCEDYVCKAVDLGREIDRRIDEYVDLTREIEKAIDELGDDRERDILRWRYLNGWKWEKIIESMPECETRTVYYLHGRALSEIEENLQRIAVKSML